jgi:primosomal protein N' (replication factor Y) (superfamily II helicase)
VLCYPPFSHLIRIVCSAPDVRSAATAARALHERLRCELASLGTSVLGPAALLRLRGRARRALLLKAHERAATVRAVDQALRDVVRAREHAGVSLSVDVDPH